MLNYGQTVATDTVDLQCNNSITVEPEHNCHMVTCQVSELIEIEINFGLKLVIGNRVADHLTDR